MKSFRKAALLVSIGILLSPLAYGQFALLHSQTVTDVETSGLNEVSFVGDGEIQYNLDREKDIAASTGLGGTYWRIWPKYRGAELQLDFVINVASTVPEIKADVMDNVITNNRAFGNYVLAPVIAGQSTDINLFFYFDEEIRKHNPSIRSTNNADSSGHDRTKLSRLGILDGFLVSAFAANQIWNYDSIYVGPNLEEITDSKNLNVSVIGWKVGLFYEFLPTDVRWQNGVSIRVEGSYIGRSIRGEAGNKTRAAVYARERFLLHDRTTYHGIELALSAKYGNIRARAALPIMHIGARDPVPGLSGTQFVTTISFVGGFRLLLQPGKNEKKG